MTVAEWLKHHSGRAVTADDHLSVDEVVKRMLAQSGVRDVYVVANDQVLGHISHQRLAHIALAEHRRAQTRRQIMDRVASGLARDLMDGHFVFARSDEQLDNVLNRMLEHDIEDLPVLDEHRQLIGAINLTAVLRVVVADEEL